LGPSERRVNKEMAGKSRPWTMQIDLSKQSDVLNRIAACLRCRLLFAAQIIFAYAFDMLLARLLRLTGTGESLRDPQ
jgi:hypothetical protein